MHAAWIPLALLIPLCTIMQERRLLCINIHLASFKFSLFILLLPDPVCHFSLNNQHCWAIHLGEKTFARLKYRSWTPVDCHQDKMQHIAADITVIQCALWSCSACSFILWLLLDRPNMGEAGPQFLLWSLRINITNFNSCRFWVISVTECSFYLSTSQGLCLCSGVDWRWWN